MDTLYSQADAQLREPPHEEPLERVGLEEDVRRIWCGSARPEYRRQTQRYNLPNRCIPLVRKGRDFVILPGHKLTREFWSLVKEVVGLNDDQAIFTSDEHFVMDDDVDDEIVAKIKALVTNNPKDRFTIVPYCVTSNFERWSSQLAGMAVTVFGESFKWVEEFGHKGILHRHVRRLDEPGIVETVAPNVRVAKGYTCDTPDDLVKAYELIGTEMVVVKPVFGAAGEGILFIDNVEALRRYDFPMGQVVLEEFLSLDRTRDGIVLSPAVHYFGAHQFGTDLVDQIMVGTGYAGWRPSQATKSFQQTCSRAVTKILKAIEPHGPGGFDFLSVDGVPYLTDVNTGRFNGAHYPKLFKEQYAPDAAFYCFRHKPPLHLSAEQYWYRLQSEDIAFVPGQSSAGVFPLVYLRGLAGLYICIGKNNSECVLLADHARTYLSEHIPISRQPRSPVVQSRVDMTLIRNCLAVFAPEVSPFRHLLLAGGKIAGLIDDSNVDNLSAVIHGSGGNIIDASGLILTPGFVGTLGLLMGCLFVLRSSVVPCVGMYNRAAPVADPHVHVAGGGGELGPKSRTPALQLSEFIRAGTTTVVGVTGTDCISRSMENLLTKVRAINEEGLTAFMWTGGYQLPSPTITGRVKRDVCLIEPCIGVGEVAVADHRGSQPTVHDLEILGSECRVGGMLAGKAGEREVVFQALIFRRAGGGAQVVGSMHFRADSALVSFATCFGAGGRHCTPSHGRRGTAPESDSRGGEEFRLAHHHVLYVAHHLRCMGVAVECPFLCPVDGCAGCACEFVPLPLPLPLFVPLPLPLTLLPLPLPL